MDNEQNNILNEVTQSEYKYGFVTDIEMEMAPKGLNEDIVRYISAKKNEPWIRRKIELQSLECACIYLVCPINKKCHLAWLEIQRIKVDTVKLNV